MSKLSEVKSLEALELAKEKALQVNTNMATMRLYELQCSAPSCDRGDGARYKTPKVEADMAFILLKKHMEERHPPAAPPTSPSCTPLTDSVKLPAVPSIAAEDHYGLLTKSLPVRIKGNRDNKSSRQEEAALKSSRQEEASLESSEEAESPLRRQNIL